MSKLKKFFDRKGQSYPHLYRDVETESFWAVIRVGKKIRKRNLKTSEYIRAITLLPVTLSELGDESSNAKAEKVRDNKLLKDHWNDLVEQKKAVDTLPQTLRAMEVIWRLHLEPYLGNWRADEVKSDMVPAFLEWHRKRFPGAQVVNVYKYLGNLLKFCAKGGYIQLVDMPELRIPKSEQKHHDKKKGRIITAEERKALLSHGSPRIHLVLSILSALGMRKMEFVAIEKSRIVLEDGRYFLELTEDDTKTGLPRVLPVPQELVGILKNQIEISGSSAYLFPTRDGSNHLPPSMIDREWVEVKRLAGIKGRLKLHDWRHTRATLMAKQNINPVIACTLLGMTIRIYQERYLKLTGRDLVQTVEQIMKAEVV